MTISVTLNRKSNVPPRRTVSWAKKFSDGASHILSSIIATLKHLRLSPTLKKSVALPPMKSNSESGEEIKNTCA